MTLSESPIKALSWLVLEHDDVSLLLDDENAFFQAVQDSLVAASWHFSLNIDVAQELKENLDAYDADPQEDQKGKALDDRGLKASLVDEVLNKDQSVYLVQSHR